MNLIPVITRVTSFATALFLLSCNTNNSMVKQEKVSDTCTILVQAEDFSNSKNSVLVLSGKNKDRFVKATTGGWLEYKIKVPVAGRYKVQFFAQTTDSLNMNCWLEDYVDNTYGRTYNITGNIPLQQEAATADSFYVTQKEGSPLDTGIHNFRLHYDSGVVMIDKLYFTLMKPHLSSTKVLLQQTTGKEWKLAWSDEFNGKGLPDSSKWVYDFGNWGWGNNELQYYTVGRTENARQEDGNLVIEARKNDNGHPWSSARLTTRGRESFLYGKIEFRAKVPVGRGSWAAGWLLGDSYVDEMSWPFTGEIDVMELVGYENDSTKHIGKSHASLHCGAYYFKLNNQPTNIVDIKNMEGEFHTYTIEWLPANISILLDGEKYFEYKDTRTDLSWPFNKPQNLLLNLAMGGGMGGPKGVDPTMVSQKVIVDYIRVYELK